MVAAAPMASGPLGRVACCHMPPVIDRIRTRTSSRSLPESWPPLPRYCRSAFCFGYVPGFSPFPWCFPAETACLDEFGCCQWLNGLGNVTWAERRETMARYLTIFFRVMQTFCSSVLWYFSSRWRLLVMSIAVLTTSTKWFGLTRWDGNSSWKWYFYEKEDIGLQRMKIGECWVVR